LRATAPIALEAKKEKRDLERIGWELRSRMLFLFGALFYTLWPLVSLVSSELAGWLGAPDTLGGRISSWGVAAFLWILYIIRIPRRNLLLAAAILLSLGEMVFVLNRVNIITSPSAHGSGRVIIGFGILAAYCWISHFRRRALARR
jgi:predicted branched-subunit amino acid permease